MIENSEIISFVRIFLVDGKRNESVLSSILPFSHIFVVITFLDTVYRRVCLSVALSCSTCFDNSIDCVIYPSKDTAYLDCCLSISTRHHVT
jgi:hypothetical protein